MRKKDAATDVGSEWSATPAGRMSPADVQEKEFHVTRVGAGYRMREVDEFLDQVTDTLSALVAENDRLKATGAPDRAGSLPLSRPAAVDPEDRGAVEAFLRREKGFLQDLGGLVQAHAEELRSMVRSVRREAVEPTVTPMASTAETVEAPRSADAEELPAPAEVEAAPAPAGTIEPDAGSDAAPSTADREDDPAPMITHGEGDEPIRLEEPEPARSRRSEDDDGNSLRELFWGEE